MAISAILFPGQGSQTPDMRDTVAALRPDLLSLVADVVGEDPFPRAEEGTMYAERYIEVGPGKVLSGLVKRTLRGVELVNA